MRGAFRCLCILTAPTSSTRCKPAAHSCVSHSLDLTLPYPGLVPSRCTPVPTVPTYAPPLSPLKLPLLKPSRAPSSLTQYELQRHSPDSCLETSLAGCCQCLTCPTSPAKCVFSSMLVLWGLGVCGVAGVPDSGAREPEPHDPDPRVWDAVPGHREPFGWLPTYCGQSAHVGGRAHPGWSGAEQESCSGRGRRATQRWGVQVLLEGTVSVWCHPITSSSNYMLYPVSSSLEKRNVS